MSASDFEASGILPVLRPVFDAADGEMQLALIRNVAVFYRLLPACVGRDARGGSGGPWGG